MKEIAIIITILFHAAFSFSQEIPPSSEQQLENLADVAETETEDDAWLLQLEHFRKHPLNLNTADADELKELRVLTALQIANLISYRQLLGPLISMYELQAVPYWDPDIIRKLLPFCTVSTPISLEETMSQRFKGGEHSLLFRVSQVLERSKGFDPATQGTRYQGSPQRIFFRCRYNYKNLLQWGLTGDKDAGEHFLKGVQNKGFDFYSFHFFARKIGSIQSLALGDFTVNMGQGLIHWQGLSFKKSAEVMGVKRQAAVLQPYNSAGEFYFHRGAGITIRKGRAEATAFASLRKLSGNLVVDTIDHENFISSFLNSGLHRTSYENADRNTVTQIAFGGNIAYRSNRWHIGVNGIHYSFSLPVRKKAEPYNLYAISGKNWYNMSIDYSYTYKNLHFFGEAAADKNSSKAFINGVLISVDPRVDISFVQRTIASAYQAVYGNAFTENTYPTNETGFYTGISIRPVNRWRLDAYADIFRFPWLKFSTDAASYGTGFLVQLTYSPNKQIELYTRYRNETKEANQPANTGPVNYLVRLPRQNWRTHLVYKINTAITLRNRVELLWYDRNGANSENGFLAYVDFLYKPLLKPVSAILRLQYFETDDYNSRIYAYENDVLYSYSIPSFFNKGYRYYLVLNYDLGKSLSLWLRLSQTIYPQGATIGSGLDEIQGNKKTEIKCQARWLF